MWDTIIKIAAAVTILGVVWFIFRLGQRSSLFTAKELSRLEIRRKRLELLYGPMMHLFTSRHVTSVKSILAGRLRYRANYAWRSIRKKHFRQAIKDLFDRKESKEKAEIEFGDNQFPLNEMMDFLKGNEGYADSKLLNLAREADRARYEHATYGGRTHPSMLIDEEFELFKHICNIHETLTRILNGKGLSTQIALVMLSVMHIGKG